MMTDFTSAEWLRRLLTTAAGDGAQVFIAKTPDGRWTSWHLGGYSPEFWPLAITIRVERGKFRWSAAPEQGAGLSLDDARDIIDALPL